MRPGVFIIGLMMVSPEGDRLRRFLKTTQQQATSIRMTISVAITPAAAITPPERPPTWPPTDGCCCCGIWFPLLELWCVCVEPGVAWACGKTVVVLMTEVMGVKMAAEGM